MADELNRWLRRVRPPTAADADDWADSDQAQQSLSDIHRRVAKVHAARRARLWTLLPAATVATAAATVLVVTAVSTPDNNSSHHAQPPTLTNLRPAAKLLTPFSSCDTLLNGLRSHAVKHLDQFGYGFGGVVPDYAKESQGGVVRAPATMPSYTSDSQVAPRGAGGAADTSTTNVQEAGVDEPDVVKTDGDRVLTVTDSRLRVLDAGTRTQLGSLDLRSYSGAQSAQLLASGDTAVVLLTAATNPVNFGGPLPAGPGGSIRSGAMPLFPSLTQNTSTLLYVDLAGSPRISGMLTVDGSIVDARMVGTTVRVVASSAPRIEQPKSFGSGQNDYQNAIKSAIQKAPIKDWLPSYTISGPNGRVSTVPCESVSHPADYSAASMLTVYTVDPTKPNADPQPVTLTADGNTVYATTSSLYVASNPSCVWCGRLGTETGSTQIHRFDITGAGKPTYLGSGSVDGSLLSQYSLSDYNGSLRIATTTTDKSGVPVSGVDVLDANTLKLTGSVGGLGKGERVYAVRFLGALGYVVTYNQQDPLYVLDLKDPTAPRQVGALEIPGFSSYLHDAGGNRLIGVGQDTSLVSEGGGSYAHNEGRMVQLFDVSDPSKPIRTAKVVLPGTGTPGDPSFDPHAFLYWPSSGLVGVPVSNYGGPALGVRLDGKSLTKIGTVDNDGSDQNAAIVRSMIVDGNLWTFSASGVRVSAQSDLAKIAWIPFG